MTATDPFDLERFVKAQAPVFETVMAELSAGKKRTHWIWFIFPQLRGLGRSPTAEFFGIGSLEEARAFLGHPVLGPRLKRCTEAVLRIEGSSLHEIFGWPDEAKFISSMTLFAMADQDEKSVFRLALDRWHEGRLDERSVELLRRT